MDVSQDSLNRSLFKIVEGNHVDRVRNIIAEGASPCARDSYQSTPLMLAAFIGLPEMLGLLHDVGADVGADVMATDNQGATALHHAFDKVDGYANAECVRQLIEWGVDVNQRDHLGRAALDVALERTLECSENSSEAIGVLIDNGANIHQDMGGNPTAFQALITFKEQYTAAGLGALIETLMAAESQNKSAAKKSLGPK